MTAPDYNFELIELVGEGHAALAAPPMERVYAALVVLPKLVAMLDVVATRSVEMANIRRDLTLAVRRFREQVWDIQKQDPGVTLSGGPVGKSLADIDSLLARLDALLRES